MTLLFMILIWLLYGAALLLVSFGIGFFTFVTLGELGLDQSWSLAVAIAAAALMIFRNFKISIRKEQIW